MVMDKKLGKLAGAPSDLIRAAYKGSAKYALVDRGYTSEKGCKTDL